MDSNQSNKAKSKPDLNKANNKSEKKDQEISSIQELISTFYLAIKETLAKMSQLKEQVNFVQMKNIDLCYALKGTVFKTQISKL